MYSSSLVVMASALETTVASSNHEDLEDALGASVFTDVFSQDHYYCTEAERSPNIGTGTTCPLQDTIFLWVFEIPHLLL